METASTTPTRRRCIAIASFIGSGINGNALKTIERREALISLLLQEVELMETTNQPFSNLLWLKQRQIASFIGSGINGNLPTGMWFSSRGAWRSLLLQEVELMETQCFTYMTETSSARKESLLLQEVELMETYYCSLLSPKAHSINRFFYRKWN